MCFSPYFRIGCKGGSSKGLVHNLLMQCFTLYLLMLFFTLGSSKIEDSKCSFLDIVATQNDHPTYVKHVLGSIYVFFFRVIWVLAAGWRGEGGSKGIGT